MKPEAFWIRESIEEDRPSGAACLQFDPVVAGGDLQESPQASAIMAGVSPLPSPDWRHPDLFVSLPGSTPVEAWDFYETSCGFGALSKKALDLLDPFFQDRFVSMPVFLDGHTYYSPRCLKRIDCLNRAHSTIEYIDFEDGSTDILRIRAFSFDGGLLSDPMIFAIPEKHLGFFCTKSVASLIEDCGLRGFLLEKCRVI